MIKININKIQLVTSIFVGSLTLMAVSCGKKEAGSTAKSVSQTDYQGYYATLATEEDGQEQGQAQKKKSKSGQIPEEIKTVLQQVKDCHQGNTEEVKQAFVALLKANKPEGGAQARGVTNQQKPDPRKLLQMVKSIQMLDESVAIDPVLEGLVGCLRDIVLPERKQMQNQ